MSARRWDARLRLSARNCPRWWCLLSALAVCGCGTWQGPRLDPTGEHIFLPAGSPAPVFPPGSSQLASPIGPAQPGIIVTPAEVIAPVGSQVVLIASVPSGEGYLLTNERVEWTLAPDGVGQILSPGERRGLDLLNWFRGLPTKVNSQYAINTTLRQPMRLDRGTPTPYDDILVQGGQAWVSIMSPTEGTSRITAYVPKVYGWDGRQQTASIYWVDAQWRFPAPAISPVGGRSLLSTTLTRQTDNSPLAGWQVRYEIAGGPPAGFAPDGATSLEVLTSDAGQASAELMQTQPTAGTNQVNIQIFRPTGGGQSRPLAIGSGSTLQSWAASGPATTTSEPAPGVAPPVSVPVESPPAQPATPAAGTLEVTANGPTSGTVGENVQFQIDIINRGTAPARRLVVKDRFDAGLQHAMSASPIERDLVDLQPGATARLNVNFRISQPGEQCQDVEVTGEGGLRATARHCLEATTPAIEQPAPGEQRWQPEPSQPGTLQTAPAEQSPATQPPGAQSPAAQPPAAGTAGLTVRKTGPDRKRVGEIALFTIEVTNGGPQPIDDLVIADNFETSLEPGRATEGNEWLEGNALGWKIGTLDAGRSVRREIEFKCLQPTPRACNRVTVTASGIQPLADEACLEIVAQGAPAPATAGTPQPPISVTVAETADPLRVGGKTTYQILIENKDVQSYFDVTVSATLSEELKLDTIASPVGTQGAVLPNSVRFVPIRELRASEAPLSFELHATGLRPGAARVTVEVTSRGQTRPATAEQTTQILP